MEGEKSSHFQGMYAEKGKAARRLRIAILGSGIAGVTAASALSKRGHDIVLYQTPETCHGVDAKLQNVGFQAFRTSTFSSMLEWFEENNLPIHVSDMSLAVSVSGGSFEWCSRWLSLFAQRSNILNPFFYRMLFDLLRFPRDATAFLSSRSEGKEKEMKGGELLLTLDQFLLQYKYGTYFRSYCFLPFCSALFSVSPLQCRQLSALVVLKYLDSHNLLHLNFTTPPQWISVGNPMFEQKTTLKASASNMFAATAPQFAAIQFPLNKEEDIGVKDTNGKVTSFDYVVMATSPSETIKLLGDDITSNEKEILNGFDLAENKMYLHRDCRLMPKRKKVWASWNLIHSEQEKERVCISYWLNGKGEKKIQDEEETKHEEEEKPLFLTINPSSGSTPDPKLTLHHQTVYVPLPTQKSELAYSRLNAIQGARKIFFMPPHHALNVQEGFENGLKIVTSIVPLEQIYPHTSIYPTLTSPLSMFRKGLRWIVHRFLKKFITEGQIVLSERVPGGQVIIFGSSSESSSSSSSTLPVTVETTIESGLQLLGEKVIHEGEKRQLEIESVEDDSQSDTTRLRKSKKIKEKETEWRGISSDDEEEGEKSVADKIKTYTKTVKKRQCVRVDVFHPRFYDRVAAVADLGLAQAYIDTDFDCNDMLTFLCILITNQRRQQVSGGISYGTLMSSYVGRSFYAIAQRILKRNTVIQSQRNISAHYDLGNEFFKFFLDPSLTYSCGIFLNPTDTLEQAQINKLDALIRKARVKSTDHVLEIGFGWSSLSVALAKKTGCRVTGITLSKEQLKYSQERVNREGLSDRIQFQLVDYRVFARTHRGYFDRILSCEMLEAVGHEYLGSFYRACEEMLKPHGLLVVQVITYPDDTYDAYRTSTDFIREYIFPGGLCPSMQALHNAMKSNSSLMVEHLENIGPHYARTLGEWRRLFHQNKNKILELGFDETFFRKWDYYLVYCQAGFQMRALSTLQIVYTRPGNGRLDDDLSHLPPLIDVRKQQSEWLLMR